MMFKLAFARRAPCFVGCLALLLASCATEKPSASVRIFREASDADLVIRYSSDQAIYRLKPDAHEGPFYHIFSRGELIQSDADRAGSRALAVVLIGHFWVAEDEAKVRQGWLESLEKLNYQRVVFLRAQDGDQVNGLAVVEDRHIAQSASRLGRDAFATAATVQPSAH